MNSLEQEKQLTQQIQNYENEQEKKASELLMKSVKRLSSQYNTEMSDIVENSKNNLLKQIQPLKTEITSIQQNISKSDESAKSINKELTEALISTKFQLEEVKKNHKTNIWKILISNILGIALGTLLSTGIIMMMATQMNYQNQNQKPSIEQQK